MGLMLRINIPKRGQKVTNGDVINALFPNVPVKIYGSLYVVFMSAQFDLKWWNAPYEGYEGGMK